MTFAPVPKRSVVQNVRHGLRLAHYRTVPRTAEQRLRRRPLTQLRWQVVLCVVIAAVSLLWSPRLEYDPWSWLVWARESVHANLQTAGGPAWKPLPVLIDSLFMLSGGAAPVLWALMVRTAGLLVLVGAGRIAALLGRPRMLAATVAVLGTALSAQLLFGLVPLGYSEPLLAALLLFAAEAWLRDRPALSFGLLVAAALVRPEAWPLTLVAAGWLIIRRRSAAPWALISLGGIGLAWYLPDALSAGTGLRSLHRAAVPTEGGALLTTHPALQEMSLAIRTPAPAILGMFALTAAALAFRAYAPPPRRALALLTGAAIGWALLCAVLVGLHRSTGETRYLIGWTASVPVVAGVGVAHAWTLWMRQPVTLRVRWAAVATLMAIAVLASVPRLGGLRTDLQATRQHNASLSQLSAAITALGGKEEVVRCGPVGAEPHAVPFLAWSLSRHMSYIRDRAVFPGTTFSVATASGAVVPPSPRTGRHVVVRAWQAWQQCG